MPRLPPGTGVVVAEVQRQLVGVIKIRRTLDPEFPLEVANGQIGKIEGALVGAGEISGQLGIGGQAGEVPTTCPDGQERALGVVHRLVALGIGKPTCERVLIRRTEVGDHHVRRRPITGGQ